MKIRIKGNTVRYRLTKSDIVTLTQVGYLEDQTQFLTTTLVYSIQKSEQEQLIADLVDHRITLFVPAQVLEYWASSNQVSIENTMPLKDGGSLFLLLEKDFKCIDGDLTEDQSDFFENPNLNC
jgi:hypothetical protein